jgi:hypothetical protein
MDDKEYDYPYSTASSFFLMKLIEPLVGDELITRDGVSGLTANPPVSQKPATRHTRLSKWLVDHNEE